MNILVLNPILFSGEKNSIPQVESIKDTMIYNMCLALIGLGHRVTLLAIDDYRPTKEESQDFEIVYFKNNFSGILPAALPFSKQMYSYLKKHSSGFDMILSSEVFAFHSLFAALIAPGKTLIWHELVAHQRKMKTIPSRIWHSVVVPIFFRKTRIVVGRSEKAVSFVSKFMSNVSETYVDHGISLSKFRLSASKKRQFISTGQLIPRKQIGTIVEVFNQFLQLPGYGDFQLLLAGRGFLENELRQQVKDLGIEDRVIFCGFLAHEALSLHLSESYASLINTNNDLNMVSIPEAIVSGTPVICNKVPALAEFINKHQLGIAKNEWGATELVSVVENQAYRDNCVLMRDHLSTTNAAAKLVEIFLEEGKKKERRLNF